MMAYKAFVPVIAGIIAFWFTGEDFVTAGLIYAIGSIFVLAIELNDARLEIDRLQGRIDAAERDIDRINRSL
jgi:hypothetical protein